MIRKFVFIVIVVITLAGLCSWGLVTYSYYHPPLLRSLPKSSDHEISRYNVDGHEQTLVRVKESTNTLVVFLHGKGADNNSYLTAELANELAKPENKHISIVFPGSSDHSYWHNRGEYAWSTYLNGPVLETALGRLGQSSTPHIVITGISMGGYGALLSAEQNPRTYCGVVMHSPAIWERAGDTAPGAFDSAEDYAANDVFAHIHTLGTTYVSIDSGDKDFFVTGDKALASKLVAGGVPVYHHTYEGGHDMKYWNSHWSDYFEFYRASSSTCK